MALTSKLTGLFLIFLFYVAIAAAYNFGKNSIIPYIKLCKNFMYNKFVNLFSEQEMTNEAEEMPDRRQRRHHSQHFDGGAGYYMGYGGWWHGK